MEKKLKSETVVVSAPMSFHGSAARIWRVTNLSSNVLLRIVLGIFALYAIFFAWVAVACWYAAFGILLIPYRVTRRGKRKQNVENLRHREILEAIQNKQ
jgi:membrane glycosyltransferase